MASTGVLTLYIALVAVRGRASGVAGIATLRLPFDNHGVSFLSS
jgi:hypothetical protein